MIAVVDACALYPTVLRQILLECADRGLFAPIWSDRLLEEWVRAAGRNGGAVDEQIARAEAAEANFRFPKALTPPGEATALWLPDPADIHVLATAIESGADTIVTLNLKDFPRRELAVHDIVATPPDAFVMDLYMQDAEAVTQAALHTHAQAERLSGQTLPLRGLLKRARLPRLGKALSA